MSWDVCKLKAAYRDQLIRELQHLPGSARAMFSDEVVKIMEAIKRAEARCAVPQAPGFVLRRKRTTRHDDILEASELYLLEVTLIEHIEPADLKLRIAGFRDMLTHLLTAESYALLSHHLIDLPRESDPDKLRAEARALASRLYRRYEGVPAVEMLRRDIVGKMFAMVGGIGIAIYVLVGMGVSPTPAWIAAAGALGAFVSTMSRLYEIDSRHEPFKTWLAIESGQMTLILAPVVGAIFGLVLLAMFWGGVVAGTAFPKLVCGPVCGPEQPLDFAKLMLWGFGAGWAERMVPDVLNKLSPKLVSAMDSRMVNPPPR